MKIFELGIPADRQGTSAPVNVAGTPTANTTQPAPKPGQQMGTPDLNSPEAQKAKQEQKKQVQAQIKATQDQLRALQQQLATIR
jgi:hypothetical protein